jgi:Zn-dependent oligopeptidase
MGETIRTEDVIKAYRELREAPERDFRETKAIRKLDELATRHRFGGVPLDCENNAERDQILDKLSSFGAQSFSQYMYGD